MTKLLFKQLFFAWIILAFLSACSGPLTAQLSTEAASQSWKTSTPEQQGMDSAQIAKLFDAIQKADELVHSVVIVRNGYLVTDANYAPFQPDTRHNINSITISVVSILIGIAIQQGYIKDVDQKMLDFFPGRKIAHQDTRKQAITIKDLLTMTSGLTEDDSGKDASADWVQYVLDQPMSNQPGKVPNFNGGGYHLLSAIIKKTTGMTALDYANKVLFGPLGISDAGWIADPQGINNGSGLLYLSSHDLAKIGLLILNNGVWNGKQIVPKDYLLNSTQHLFKSPSRSSSAWGYGYGWIIAPDGSYLADGGYGQILFVKPAQNVVIVFTGGTNEGFTQKEEDLVDQVIIPAVKSAEALPENKTSMAMLNAKIMTIEKPAQQPIPPLPVMAQTVSSKEYLLDDSEAFTFTFARNQTTLDWGYKGQSNKFQVGMENIFLTTPRDQNGMTNLFGATDQPLGHVLLALRGHWKSDDTFELTMQNLDSSRRHIVYFKFAGDNVDVSHAETIDSDSVDLHGQVQAP